MTDDLRFYPGFRQNASSKPGVVQDAVTGRVYYVKSDGSRVELGGGGAAVQTREQFFGDAVTIGEELVANLTWDNPTGDALVDVTDPAEPVVIESGVYIVAASVISNAMTADGCYDLGLYLDGDGVGALQRTGSRLATAAQPAPRAQVCFAFYIPAGGTIYLECLNRDGVASRNFTINEAEIQRVS